MELNNSAWRGQKLLLGAPLDLNPALGKGMLQFAVSQKKKRMLPPIVPLTILSDQSEVE